ncbi:hypothetical protein THRCLA_20359 [Thraustotheca clavata]|uniref:Uncharacterized protein n=1 Tax=Thraustotheca clavata TaxID=74557 RepID=A0A1W0A8F2_9STRA|nr:hypothetical protein THRCLA_20359 [Thraustotheca clavata]
MPMHEVEHRWLWKIIAVCVLLGSIGMFGPAVVLRETPRERLTNLAAAQAELDRKRDLVRSKRIALQEEMEALQLKASSILKGLAWRKVREEDYNAERIRHIEGIREYLADGRAKMEKMVLETTQTLKNTFHEVQKHVEYVGTHNSNDESYKNDEKHDENEPIVEPETSVDDGLPTIQIQPQQVIEEPKIAPLLPTVLPKPTPAPAPAPRPTKLRPKPSATAKPIPTTSWFPDTMTIIYVGGSLILVVLVLAMLSSLYEQQVGYPFTPRKPKTRTSLGGKEDRVTRNLDFGEVNEEEEEDGRGNRGNLYGTEFIPTDESLLTPTPVRRSRRLHRQQPSIFLSTANTS